MNLVLKLKQFSALIFLSTLVTFNLAAQTAEEKGLQIAKQIKQRDMGWQDSVAEMSMILRNAQGQETERKMRTKTLEIQDDGDKGLTIFDQPRDVSGTAFLNFSHALEPDEQWMYLPALKRVKRISSRNKSGPFMGSEFSFEDMSSFEIEKYTFKYLRDETYEGREVYILQQVPVDKHSGYTRQLVWVDKERYIALKIEFYDRKDSLLKTLHLYEYTLYLDKYWRAMRSEMINAQNGKSTELTIHSLVFKSGLEDREFNKNALKRAR